MSIYNSHIILHPSKQNFVSITLESSARAIHLALGLDVGGNTVLAIRSASNLLWLTRSSTSESVTDLVGSNTAGVGDLGSITEVGVDTSQQSRGLCEDVVHDDVSSFAVGGAVSAGSVELAKGVDVEVLDVESSEAVELEDLVRGGFGTTTVDVGGSRGLFECSSVYINVVSLLVLVL